jgi:glutamate-ammonia-ligase adenylyltransferase
MGHEGWEQCREELDRHRVRVHQHFERVFAAPQATTGDPRAGNAAALVLDEAVPIDRAIAILGEHGVAGDPAAAFVQQVREVARSRRWSERAVQYLTRLLPLLLGAVAKQADPATALLRVWEVMDAVARRVTYLALLVENPTALSQLVTLCAASPWITRELSRHPVLLDELLDPRTLYQPPRRAALQEEMARQAEHVPGQDLEAQMDLIRRFRQTNTLRVAAADISGSIPLMVVSDHLTEIAEVVVAHAVQNARDQLLSRFGRPLRTDGSEAGFAVIAYGKLGGLELGYGSDLDLVFVHDGDDANMTSGDRQIEHAAFFTRFAQRLIHLLTTHTHSGVAYAVDMELRPSGGSGLVVTTLDAFRDYQLSRAWTWEHQALVRARPIAGSPNLGARFEAVRVEVLSRPRDPARLLTDVRSMRAKMRGSLGARQPGTFDLKHGLGGITDIEFIVQYSVLRDAHRHPGLVRYTDNIRQLEALAACNLMPDDDARELADCYRAYRSAMHRLKLQESEGVVADTEFVAERDAVIRHWRSVFGAEDG